jgi:CubicO group peptidase (beta-lactamase class C family)
MEDNRNALEGFVTETMESLGVPGVAVGILRAGKTYTAGHGITHVDHPLPVTPDTLFQIGSITKTYTATVMLRLVEMGKLGLDVPIRAYIPDFKVKDETASAQATIRHLLTHTAGWTGDFFIDTGVGDDALPRYTARMAELEQLIPLGTLVSYNNAGFYLAGHIIEVVTGKRYEAAMQELLFEPLGLTQSYFNPTDVMVHRFVVGHNITPEGTKVATPWPLPRAAWSAGGIVCSVGDLLRYAQFHLAGGKTTDGTQLLSPESIAAMHTVQVETDGWMDGVGLSWFVDTVAGTRTFGHGGGTVGQVSQLTLVPEHHFAFASVTNANRGGELTQAVGRWILKQYLGLESTDPTPVDASEMELAGYVGVYSRPMADLTLTLEDGQLMAHIKFKQGFPTPDAPPPAPPPTPVGITEAGHLIALEGPFKNAQGQVIRSEDGSIRYIRFSGRLHKRLTPEEQAEGAKS